MSASSISGIPLNSNDVLTKNLINASEKRNDVKLRRQAGNVYWKYGMTTNQLDVTSKSTLDKAK